MTEKPESYRLISESSIIEINNKIDVLNKGAQIIKDKGYDNLGDRILEYTAQITAIVNLDTYPCNVSPQISLEDLI